MQQKLECSGLASKVELNHLLTIEALSKQEITAILDRAQELIDKSYNTKAVLRDLASITVANLFLNRVPELVVLLNSQPNVWGRKY